MKNGAIYVVIGDRDIEFLCISMMLLRAAVENIPIIIYHTDEGFKETLIQKQCTCDGVIFKKVTKIKYDKRENNRNSSLWRLKALLESPFENTVYMDNDIFIVHPGFKEGFRIAEHYGLAMAQNPRMFIKTYEGTVGDVEIGEDISDHDSMEISKMPKYMTALNMGIIFYNKKREKFIKNVLAEQESHPSRGQASLARAIWKTKYSPYTLPLNWLVCRAHEGITMPITLHAGHENILEWWKRDFI